MPGKPQEAGVGTEVPVEMSATAVVNPPEPEFVTMYGRVTGLEYPVPNDPDHILSAQRDQDLVLYKYDLDATEAEFFAAFDGARPLFERLAADRKKKGYVTEAFENAANMAWGEVLRRWQLWTLALGAVLPNEGQVASWSEHRKAAGEINLDRYPKLIQAKLHESAIDEYEKVGRG